MSVSKRILKSVVVQNAACWVGSLYIRFVYATTKWETINGQFARERWDENQPFILAFWHGRGFLMPYVWDTKHPIHMLVSQHRDGQIISRVISHFGIKTIVGSTSRGGSAALRVILRTLKSGKLVGITPDGPRGPRMRVSGTVIDIARLSGVPILPCTYSISKGAPAGSWDRFLIGKPFSKGVFIWGEPITVPRNSDEAALADARVHLEEVLNRISAQADDHCGREPILPATAEIDLDEHVSSPVREGGQETRRRRA